MSSVLNTRFFILTIIFSTVYLLLNVYFANWSLFNHTFLGNFPFEYKIKLSFALTNGLVTTMSVLNFYSLIIISVLTGLNIALLLRVFKNLAFQKAQMAFGMGSIFGLAGSGCASCGLPVLGLLGLSSSVVNLPFKGLEISVLSILMLVFSFIYLYKSSLKSCLVRN